MAIQQDASGAEVYFQPRRLGHANIFITDVDSRWTSTRTSLALRRCIGAGP